MDFSFIVPEIHTRLMLKSTRHHLFSSFYAISGEYREFTKIVSSRGDLVIIEAGFSSSLKGTDIDRLQALDQMIDDLKEQKLIVVLPFDDSSENAEWLQRKWNGHELGPKMLIPMLLLKGHDLDTVLLPLFEFLDYYPLDTDLPWIGLSKELETVVEGNLGGRAEVLRVYSENLRPYKLWLAGIYKDPMMEIGLAKQAAKLYEIGLWGVDSTKLWRLCSQGRKFSEISPYPESFNFFGGTVSNEICSFVEGQFDTFRELVSS